MLLLLLIADAKHMHTHRIAVFAVSTTFSAMGIAILFKRTTPFSMENFVANDTTPLAWAIIQVAASNHHTHKGWTYKRFSQQGNQ